MLSVMFDEGVTLAATTGFRLWEASDLFCGLLDGDLGDLVDGKRVLELGSGTGLVGCCAAAAGGHVVLTDVKSILDQSTARSLAHNAKAAGYATVVPSPWGDGDIGMRRIGRGSAATSELYWGKAVKEQCRVFDFMTAEVILACDCIWLVEMLDLISGVLETLLSAPHRPHAYISYEERGKENEPEHEVNKTFTTLKMVLGCFEENGLTHEIWTERQEKRLDAYGGEERMARVLILKVWKK